MHVVMVTPIWALWSDAVVTPTCIQFRQLASVAEVFPFAIHTHAIQAFCDLDAMGSLIRIKTTESLVEVVVGVTTTRIKQTDIVPTLPARQLHVAVLGNDSLSEVRVQATLDVAFALITP